MGDMVKNMLGMFWVVFKWPVYLLGALLAAFGLLCLIYALILFVRGERPKKGVRNVVKQRSVLKSLFSVPKMVVHDFFEHDPEYFGHQGVICFCGRQGSGKTISLIEQTMRWQQEYPKAKVISNCAYAHSDEVLGDWRQLIDYTNGIQGVIVQMDEMQNWFSSNQSKNFPPEMLEVITQNRKNRRVILGTAQVFCRLAKPIREQITEVRNCFTFFGCFTVVHRVAPEINSEGVVEKYRHLGWYCFIQSEKLRSAYDTYQVIHSLGKSGFQPRQTSIAEDA